MAWIQDTIINFFDSIVSMFNFLYNMIKSTYEVLGFIPNIISNITTGLGYIPAFLLPFASICLAISVIYLVVGRDHA